MAHYNKRLITFFMTTKCNLRCTYCITSSMDREDRFIDLDFVRTALEEYFERTGNFKVRFYAVGEPTQNLEGMQSIHRMAQELSNGRTYFEMISNGFYGEETLVWVGNHIDRVWVSYDGPRDNNDRYRLTRSGTPSTEIVLNTIKQLKQMTSVGIGLTVCKTNCFRQVEVIDEVHELGIKSVFSKAILDPVDKMGEATSWGVNIMDYAKGYLEAWRHARELGISYLNDLVFNFDGHCPINCRACAPTPHITMDGHVSSCDRAYSGDTPLQDMIYGTWNPEKQEIIYFPDKIRKLQKRSVENMPGCKDCEVRYQCGGQCLGTTYQFTGDMFKTFTTFCPAIKYLHEHMNVDKGEYWPVEYET